MKSVAGESQPSWFRFEGNRSQVPACKLRQCHDAGRLPCQICKRHISINYNPYIVFFMHKCEQIRYFPRQMGRRCMFASSHRWLDPAIKL